MTLATATPAFAACSQGLKIASTANYVNYTNASTVQPNLLDVSVTITNECTTPLANVQVQLRIPESHYLIAPRNNTAATMSGGGSLSGGNASGTSWSKVGTDWVLTLNLTASIPASGSRVISVQVRFYDGGNKDSGTGGFSTTDAPYRRWAGNAFTMANTATATGILAPAEGPASVTATPNCTFKLGGTCQIYWWSSGQGVTFDINDMWNDGRSSIGRVKMRMEIDKHYDSERFGGGFQAAPVAYSDSASHATKWNFLNSNAGGNNASNSDTRWYWNLENKLAGWAPSSGSGGPSTDLDGPASGWAFSWKIVPLRANGGVGFTGIRQLIISAPHATTTAMDESGTLGTPV